ncbi:MAG: hypothetical protein DWQ07_23690 [Chloroflexi bacterium]|nr:MAG: hypothetical protein DWQ07_23690 [Chloroflexota bacterium]MBL1194152.1 hypothetical protein [Chloroflexota bacterium]NOH11445.1 hypothetical protein [Chloroflexota bacterium]
MNSSMTQPNDPRKNFDLRSGVTIYPSQQKEIDQVLNDLLNDLPAHFILLADTRGQIVTIAGVRGDNSIAALGSLVAGDIAASREMARITGEYREHQTIMREGEETNMIVSEAGPHLVLLVQVLSHVPLGWSRLKMREVCERLKEILEILPDREEVEQFEFNQETMSEQVRDAIDSIWLGDSGE